MSKIAGALVFAIFIAGGLSLAAADDPIGSLFKKQMENRVPVKVFIKEVVNQSGQAAVIPAEFTRALAISMHKRRALKFEVVKNAVDSDISISAVIQRYRYLDKGPFKPSIGIQTMILDAAATMTQNYVDMLVNYTVTDTKSGEKLWEGTVDQYIKKKMTLAESMTLINDVVTRTFLWKCFGKANSRNDKINVM
mgnify:CR=1 FL=1